MKTYISVKGSIKEVRRPRAGDRVPSGERLVRIGFLLKDILKVFAEEEDEDEITMSQCCYEQKKISLYSSQVDNANHVRQVVYQTLQGDLLMNEQSAEMATPDVVRTIRESVQSTDPSFRVVLLEVHVECSIEKQGREPGEPRGEHGYDRLVERFDDDACGICHQALSSFWDMDITTCHHAYHHSCLLRWLYRGTRTCPICRSNLAPIVGAPLDFDE